MSGKKPWGWEVVQIGKVLMARGLYGWYHLLRMTEKKRVSANVIPEAVDDCKGEGFQPCGAALGLVARITPSGRGLKPFSMRSLFCMNYGRNQ
jgi:hypothetical protein